MASEKFRLGFMIAMLRPSGREEKFVVKPLENEKGLSCSEWYTITYLYYYNTIMWLFTSFYIPIIDSVMPDQSNCLLESKRHWNSLFLFKEYCLFIQTCHINFPL